jgi:hypothetical protein
VCVCVCGGPDKDNGTVLHILAAGASQRRQTPPQETRGHQGAGRLSGVHWDWALGCRSGGVVPTVVLAVLVACPPEAIAGGGSTHTDDEYR